MFYRRHHVHVNEAAGLAERLGLLRGLTVFH